MSDNTTLNAGSGGDAVRSIDKAGAKTQVVTLDLGGSGPESLVAGALPVTGTFWQTTQPVSGTVGVSNFPATQAVSGTVALDSTTLAALETISVANFPATQAVSGTVGISGTVPVSGTFWQATQPVSGTVAVSNFPASQAVTGTFWQATQPVSIASMPTTPVTGTFWQATQPVSIAATVATAPVAGTNNIGRVTRSTDVGRTLVTISYTSTSAAAADTLVTSLSVNRGGTVTTGVTSVAVTSGKTLRITGACISLRTTTAATPWGLLLLRMNPSGTAAIGSGVVARMGVSGTAAVIGNAGFSNPCMDEGLEFSGTQQIGLSFSNNVATNVTDITLFGYEYTTPA